MYGTWFSPFSGRHQACQYKRLTKAEIKRNGTSLSSNAIMLISSVVKIVDWFRSWKRETHTHTLTLVVSRAWFLPLWEGK